MLPFSMLRPRQSPPSSSAPPPRTPNPIGALARQISPLDLQLSAFNSHSLRLRNLFRIRTSAKFARNLFRISTSTTKDLKPFRMNTYEKNGSLFHGTPAAAHRSRFRPCSPLVTRHSPLFCAQTRHTRHSRVEITPIPSCACAHFPSPMGGGPLCSLPTSSFTSTFPCPLPPSGIPHVRWTALR